MALATFALGIAEFGMMGILSDVATGTGVSISTAGHLISAYSLGVAVGAPMLILLRRMPLRRLLLMLAAVIAAGNAAAMAAPGFYTLLGARFVSGLPHGAFFGAGAMVCQRLARPGFGAQAVAIMVGGMTVANLVGVPLATLGCSLISWRFAFGVVALCAILSIWAIRRWVPVMDALPDTGVKGQFAFLRHRAPWLIYAGVFFGQASVYCYLSYVEPAMTHLAGFSMADMSWIMMVAGLGMVVGNAMAGKLADRFGAALVSGVIALALVGVMTAVYFCAADGAVAVGLLFVATAGLFGIGGPLQFLIVRYARGGEMLGGAGIQIAFNVSNAVSALIGGIAIGHGLSFASPAIIGAPLALVGAAALLWLARASRRTQGAA